MNGTYAKHAALSVSTLISLIGILAVALATADFFRYAIKGEEMFHEPVLLALLGMMVAVVGVAAFTGANDLIEADQ